MNVSARLENKEPAFDGSVFYMQRETLSHYLKIAPLMLLEQSMVSLKRPNSFCFWALYFQWGKKQDPHETLQTDRIPAWNNESLWLTYCLPCFFVVLPKCSCMLLFLLLSCEEMEGTCLMDAVSSVVYNGKESYSKEGPGGDHLVQRQTVIWASLHYKVIRKTVQIGNWQWGWVCFSWAVLVGWCKSGCGFCSFFFLIL